MHLMHFGVVNNNDSNKTEARLKSFDLSTAAAFLMETLMAGPSWVFQGVSASRCGCHWEAPGAGCRSINQLCAEHPQKREGVGMKGFAPGPFSPF